MARITGDNGKIRVDVATTPAGTLTEITSVVSYSYGTSRDEVDMTAMGDANKTAKYGKGDATLSVTGIVDLAQIEAIEQACDGQERDLEITWDRDEDDTIGKAGTFVLSLDSINVAVGNRAEFSFTAKAVGAVTGLA